MSKIKTIQEIEAENSRLSNIQATNWKKEERYTHTVLDDEGFVFEPDVAKKIISALDPSKLTIQCDRYYFINDKYSAAMVGVDNNNVGLFTLELPVEVATTVNDPTDLAETLKFFKNRKDMYRKVRVYGYACLGLITALIICITYCAFGLNSTTAVMMLCCAIAFMVVLFFGLGG